MATLTYHPDAFRGQSFEQVSLGPNETIRSWVDARFPRSKEFPFTTVCLLNDRPLLRQDWGLPLNPDDRVVFISNPNWEIFAWVVVSLVVGAAAMYYLTPTPKIPGGLGDPDPVYSIRGQSNQNRLGSQIEDAYGLNRLWPSKATNQYTKFVNNEQEIYILVCLGNGYFDLENAVVQIEDTAIANFQDTEFEFYGPGESVTLFPDNVETSGEVSDIQLFAPNEEDYADWVGPFAANSAGTQTNKLEVDLTFPGGLYYGNDDGGLDPVNVTAAVEYREIDDAGSPVGAGTWETFTAFTKTLSTNTPQRFTQEKAVTLGRYEVRVRRTSNADISESSNRTVEVLKWVGLRAFLPSTKDYGDVTLLAVRARASNNLNNNSSNRVNVIATRMLPIWNGEVWSAPTSTRSVVWAFCNALRADYNVGLVDEYLDLETLLALNAEFEEAEIYFDHVFDRKGPAWATLEVIARAANALPMTNGAQVTMVLDENKTIPKAVFTKENIVEGTFSADYRLFTDDEFDGVEIEYEDLTSFQKTTVSCLVGDDLGDNLEQIVLPGVKNRTRAWRIGMRIREARKLRRVAVKFRTGLEGAIAGYNDLILVCHEVIEQGAQTGRVLNIDGTVVTTDTALNWTAGTKSLALRTRFGGELGPFTVTQGTTPYKAVLGSALTTEQLALLLFDEGFELPIFAFGNTTEYARKCRVTNIDTGEGEEIEVSAIEDDPTIYSHDDETPPSFTPKTVPAKAPDLPLVTGLSVRDIPAWTTISQADWNSALGAAYYVVEAKSGDGEWVALGQTSETYFRFTVNPGEYQVRVAAVNAGKGPWSTVWTGELGQPLSTGGGWIGSAANAVISQQTQIQNPDFLVANDLFVP